MYNLKKFLARIIIGAVLLSMLTIGQTAIAQAEFFNDVSGHENASSIFYLYDMGVVVGYEDGSYGPDLNINRAEFLKIVMEVSAYDPSGQNCYGDVTDQWFAGYVCKATELGLVDGYPDGFFHPEREINFAEASKIVANTLGLTLGDANEEWFQRYVLALEEKNAIPNSFNNFDHKITRGEMAEMVYRIDAEADYRTSNTYNNLKGGKTVEEGVAALENFSSCTSLNTYLKEQDLGNYGRGGGSMDGMAEGGGAPTAMPTVADSSEEKSAGSDDYSGTNTQIQGVDEADIVKTDGKYIYIVSGDSVRVVEAYPPANMKELDKVTFDDDGFYPTDMYVDDDKLVVIGNSYDFVYPALYEPREGEVLYDLTSTSLSKVYIFDVSNGTSVKLLRELSFEGYYDSSRKVDNMLYVVMNKYQYLYNDLEGKDPLVPLYYDSATDAVEQVAGCGDVYYVPGVVENQYLVVAGIPVDDIEGEVVKEAVLGSSGDIFSSRDNLYVAEPRYSWYDWGTSNSNDEKTIVHKFGLSETDIDYKGKGEVPGTILNQFSMDEYDGYFRIATTLGDVWDTDNPSTNNVYVMDGSLNVVGSVEGLAPGERIYSTRFSGDRGYVVTFKKVDPFFVIDLADPTNPNVLGKLKIPGFSDYLHVFDENHVIGFGLDTDSATEEELEDRGIDFAWYQGVKLAMFDVTDVENPTELHRELIGDRGTSSPLSYNHKALLFDKAKGIMAFPITVAEIPEDVKNDPNTSADTYGDYVFQGAYVYDVSVEDGFELRGTITHYDADEVYDESGYYWYGEKDIDRILYIGNYFFTVSRSIVMANNMTAPLDEVNRVELSEVINDYYYY